MYNNLPVSPVYRIGDGPTQRLTDSQLMNFTLISLYITWQVIRITWNLVRTHMKVDTEVQTNWYIPKAKICLIEEKI